MKHFTMWFPALVVTALGLSSAQAQTCQADLFMSNYRSRGNLVRVGNSVVLVDRRGINTVVSIDRRNIQSARTQNDVLWVATKRPVSCSGCGAVAEQHFTFQLASNYCQPVASWVCEPWSAAPVYREARRPRPPRQPERWVFWAEQRRTWRPDLKGQLIITHRLIEFKSRDGGRPQRWALSGLRDIEQETPYLLKITPRNSDEQTFVLQDKGLHPAAFGSLRAIVWRGNNRR